MKKLVFIIIFSLAYFLGIAQEAFQLAPPHAIFNSGFFENQKTVILEFDQANTQIHYTTNNKIPNESDPIYTQPIVITKNKTTLKARSFGKEFIASDPISMTFIKSGLPIKSIRGTAANPKYMADGFVSLHDNLGGIPSLSSKTWMGYQDELVEIEVDLTKKEKVRSILLNFLNDHGSWIFLPVSVEASFFNSKTNKFESFSTVTTSSKQDKNAGNFCYPLELTSNKCLKTKKLKVQIHLLTKIPEWHDGRGQKSWIFIDELKVYSK